MPRTYQLAEAERKIALLREALDGMLEVSSPCIHPRCPIFDVGAWCCEYGFARAALKS